MALLIAEASPVLFVSLKHYLPSIPYNDTEPSSRCLLSVMVKSSTEHGAVEWAMYP